MRSLFIFIVSFIFAITSYSQTESYDGSFIRFHLYGKGEPVFVLSGGPGNDCRQEEDVAIKIGEHYQAILLEQRGTGLSMPTELNKCTINLANYIRDILFVMDSLKITKAKFYGHSWGAMYATIFATQYPDKVTSLILTGPGFLKYSKKYNITMTNNRLQKLTKEERKRYNILYDIDADKRTPEQQSEYLSLRMTFNLYDTTNWDYKYNKLTIGSANAKTFSFLTDELAKIKYDITGEVKSLPMPITIITCREDPLAFLTEEFIKFAPQAEIHWLNQCGHFPMYEQPDAFYAQLKDALTR